MSKNYNSELQSNNTDLQAILNTINELPEAGGVELPELSNPGTAADLLSGKELIDGEGNIITGTIASKTSINLIASGATVTVPAGYYASQVSKSVATGSAKTPATTMTKNPSISVNSSGLITASVSGTQSVTPTVSAGYVSSGTAGTITVSGSATKQLTTQAAQTITPGTSNKTIASGRYLTGTQTIKGDSNLVASNIKSGVSIFGVTGSYEGSGGSGGGVNLGTCTVTVTTDNYNTIDHIIYDAIENGKIVHKEYSMLSPESGSTVTLTNVWISGTFLLHIYPASAECWVNSTNAELLWYMFAQTFFFAITASEGDNVSISVFDND